MNRLLVTKNDKRTFIVHGIVASLGGQQRSGSHHVVYHSSRTTTTTTTGMMLMNNSLLLLVVRQRRKQRQETGAHEQSCTTTSIRHNICKHGAAGLHCEPVALAPALVLLRDQRAANQFICCSGKRNEACAGLSPTNNQLRKPTLSDALTSDQKKGGRKGRQEVMYTTLGKISQASHWLWWIMPGGGGTRQRNYATTRTRLLKARGTTIVCCTTSLICCAVFARRLFANKHDSMLTVSAFILSHTHASLLRSSFVAAHHFACHVDSCVVVLYHACMLQVRPRLAPV